VEPNPFCEVLTVVPLSTFKKGGAKPILRSFNSSTFIHLYPPLKKVEPNPFCEVLTVVPLDFFYRMFCSTFLKSGKENNIR
jgi:hypothetical protein